MKYFARMGAFLDEFGRDRDGKSAATDARPGRAAAEGGARVVDAGVLPTRWERNGNTLGTRWERTALRDGHRARAGWAR
eukprot:CAMPEP_0172173826 /NCGR_PEP_ID=MMETSP1050-20130122/13304_1 /TAXON_ID=233186 /ORGANISM="Cryptomonas curvata, Strain CCAP979/52" /LENGTH=78 /DNA_ID=CAMNT_0012845693 /DNA_START=183 /DNA_END=417 /DNA_ORIENTATION=-